MLRDLFQQDDGGWLQDPVPLDRLAGEKLKAEARTIVAEAGSGSRSRWISHGHTSGLRRLSGTTIDLTDEERAEREKLRTSSTGWRRNMPRCRRVPRRG